MALLEILHYPDPALRNTAKPVQQVDDGIRKLIDDMLETMYEAPGIGLAAIQVGVAKRVITVDISHERNDPHCLVNPEVIETEGEVETEEGCLSVPEYYDTVARAESIKVRALNREGETIEFEADGMLAVCIQHEIDHLDGKLFVDYLSQLKQRRLRKKMKKQAKAA